MKINSNRFLKCLFFLALYCVGASGQVAYKGQLYINNERFQRKGDLLHVYMKVSYDNSAIGSGESLTFTPVLKTDSSVTHLTSVVINGFQKEKAEHRYARRHRRRSNVAVVVRENRSGKRSFIYDTTIPYKTWMENSSVYIESEECNCNGHRAHTYEDRILASIPFTQEPKETKETTDPSVKNETLLTWVQFLRPEVDAGNGFVKTGVISWYGDHKLVNLDEKKQNSSIYDVIFSDIKGALQYYGTTLTGVNVTGYGAPVGDYKKNETLAMGRALSLKRCLMSNHLTNKNSLEVSWVTEDWDSIATLISNSNMSLKEAALDIIKSVDVVNGRENVLENLNHGVPYEYMRHNIFPQVCRVTYKLTFNRQGMDAQTGRLMVKNNPATMSLNDFYTVAMSYNVGSREFNDIMDLAARLFPDNPEANIDAAAVALTRKDTKLARKYLLRWQTSPRAYNNMGILNLLEGNKDKAEVYLQMAQAAGVEQASTILKYMKSMK
jgi:hypothetical protein